MVQPLTEPDPWEDEGANGDSEGKIDDGDGALAKTTTGECDGATGEGDLRPLRRLRLSY